MTWETGGFVKMTPGEKARIAKKMEEEVREAVKQGIPPVFGSSSLHWRLWRERIKEAEV